MDKRKLNEIEYLIWAFGQPNNICMSVTIEGKLDKERLRNALDKVQEKHPMLRVQLITYDKQITVFTIQEKMYFHLHYYSPPYLPENMRTYVENAKRKINDILETEQ